MNQVSFQAFALRAQQCSRGGVNLNPVGGPSGAGGPSVCATKKRRKPRPVDQLPLPLTAASSRSGRLLQYEKQWARDFPRAAAADGLGLLRLHADRLIQAGVQ